MGTMLTAASCARAATHGLRDALTAGGAQQTTWCATGALLLAVGTSLIAPPDQRYERERASLASCCVVWSAAVRGVGTTLLRPLLLLPRMVRA